MRKRSWWALGLFTIGTAACTGLPTLAKDAAPSDVGAEPPGLPTAGGGGLLFDGSVADDSTDAERQPGGFGSGH